MEEEGRKIDQRDRTWGELPLLLALRMKKRGQEPRNVHLQKLEIALISLPARQLGHWSCSHREVNPNSLNEQEVASSQGPPERPAALPTP